MVLHNTLILFGYLLLALTALWVTLGYGLAWCSTAPWACWNLADGAGAARSEAALADHAGCHGAVFCSRPIC